MSRTGMDAGFVMCGRRDMIGSRRTIEEEMQAKRLGHRAVGSRLDSESCSDERSEWGSTPAWPAPRIAGGLEGDGR
jgi:hypothetical protein